MQSSFSGEGGDSNADRLFALQRQAEACEKCGLAAMRRNVVFGEGNPDAPLVFVGEGPGENEDATGRPFVGRAGQLLDDAMRECGITRKHIYICNTIKCRACVREGVRARNRPPMPEEMQACFPWLDQQLTILKPLVIVCLGAPAANTLIHKNFRMLAERGQWFDTCKYARYVTAALHPAYILRQHGEAFELARASLVQDINSAKQKVKDAKKEAPRTLL